MNKFLKITFIFFNAFVFGVSFANTSIDIEVLKTTIKTEQESETKTSTNQSYQVNLELGQGFFAYTQGNFRHIYDFDKLKIYRLNLASSFYSEDSLYSEVGFKALEFENRKRLNRVLKQANVEQVLFDPILNEHLFSIKDNSNNSTATKTNSEHEITFTYQDLELLAFSRKSHALVEHDYLQFLKYFIYVYGAHPDMLAELKATKKLPHTIRITQHHVVETQYQLKIAKPKKTSSKLYSLEGFKLGVIDDHEKALMEQLLTFRLEKKLTSDENLANYLKQAQQYFENQQYLDAMLAYFEYNLVSGKNLPDQFQDHKKLITLDKSVRLLFSSLQAKNKEEAENNIEALKTLTALAKHKVHIAKVFMANNYLVLRNVQQAKTLFVDALSENPYLVGAYNDLGQIYFKQFQMVYAWRLWDVAREIVPKHPMLQNVYKLEEQLKTKNPQFF